MPTLTKLEGILIGTIVLILIVVGFAFYFEHRGAKECKQADATAVTKQEAHNADVLKTDIATNTQIEDTLHAAEIAPITAPVVRVCYYKASPVPNSTPTAGGPDVSTPVREEPVAGPDIGRPVLTQGRNADAQIAGLQAYIAKVCLVR
jgi:hypothetical protein